MSKRKFVSIYFKNGLSKKRKKRDVTISFKIDDPLFEKCKDLGSSKIKELIGINSYDELVKRANEEDRKISNFIKFKVRKKLNVI